MRFVSSRETFAEKLFGLEELKKRRENHQCGPFCPALSVPKKPAGLMLEDDLTIVPTMNAGSFNYRATQWIILLSSDNLLHTRLIWHSQTAEDGPVIFIKRINNDSCLGRKAVLMAADQMRAHYGKSDRSGSAAGLTVRGGRKNKKTAAVLLPCLCHCRTLAKLGSRGVTQLTVSAGVHVTLRPVCPLTLHLVSEKPVNHKPHLRRLISSTLVF